jgi:predicted DNA-binding protein
MSDRFDSGGREYMKDDRITVRFSLETRRRLRAAARRGGRRESDLVRDAVEAQLAREDRTTAYEHAKRAGLIGAAKGKVRDLSTNPKYFDGFGELLTAKLLVDTGPIRSNPAGLR